MSTGGFQSGPFRTAASQGSLVEALLTSLNEARGSAYEPVPGSVVWVENLAMAKTLADAWETSRRFSLQFDPKHMSTFIERWESILQLSPSPSDTLTSRRNAIAERFKLFNQPANSQATVDYLRAVLDSLFVSVIHSSTANATSFIPGGATIPGGVTLASGGWRSSIHYLAVRLVQPLSMLDDEFYDTANKFKRSFENFIPAHTTYAWGRFAEAPGAISLPVGTLTVTGVGTAFQTHIGGPLVQGDIMELWDSERNLVNLEVDQVISDTVLLVKVPHIEDISAKPWRRMGFFLDQTNLDNSFLK